MRHLPGLRRLAFVLTTAAIVGVTSERVFWYWSTNPVGHLDVTLVYAPAAGGCLWLLHRYRVRDLWGVLLVAPMLGYLVEGVVTPVLYTGGPFVPFFPAWFAFWHGGLGLVLVFVLFRSWLVDDRPRPILVASAGLGAFWGMWSTSMWLPENVEDPELVADQGGTLEILGPGDFAIYAVTFTAILMTGHWILGRVWCTDMGVSKTTRWVWIGLTLAAVTAWTVVIPWALPMFVAYVAVQRWGLRHHAAVDGVPLLERLSGPVPVRRLLPIVSMAAVASATYALMWELEPPEDLVRYGVMYATIGVQAVVGGWLMVRSLRRARSEHDAVGSGPPRGPAAVGAP